MTADLWVPAVWTQFRAGNLTPLFRDVLLRLQKFDRRRGLWPSHNTLAEGARCSVRTVQDALKQASRIVAQAKVMARALVGKMRGRKEHQEANKMLTGQRSELQAWPQPQAPLRSVAEQLAILASWTQEEAAQAGRRGIDLTLPTPEIA